MWTDIIMPAIPYRHEAMDAIAKMPAIYPSSAVIGSSARIIVEVGPGRGDFLFHLAEKNADAQVVGIEIKRKRADKLIQRVEHRGLANVVIVHDDARHALPHLFGTGSIDEIHINFPDPWPKRRHAKNRAASAEFLKRCAAALKPGGTLTFITDHLQYAMDVSDYLLSIPDLRNAYRERYLTDVDDVFPTLFAMKWREEGRRITYQKYFKTK